MITAEVGDTKAHGAVIATSPASIPLQAMVTSGLSNMKYHRIMAAAEPATAARLVFMAITEIRKSVAQGGTRVETHPSKQEDESARNHVDKVMSGKGTWLTIPSVFAKPGSQNDGKSHRAKSPHRVHHCRTCKVDVSMSEIPGRAKLRHPATAPYPATEHGIQDPANEQFRDNKGPEGNALTDRADDDITRSLHENEFEESQNIAARVICRTAQQKPSATQNSPRAAAQEKSVQSGDSSNVA